MISQEKTELVSFKNDDFPALRGHDHLDPPVAEGATKVFLASPMFLASTKYDFIKKLGGQNYPTQANRGNS